MPTIEATDLCKSYGPVRALRGVSFRVDKGEVIGLLGPNGAGKTTLMKLLTGYLEPDGGRAVVGGYDVVERPLEVQRRLGYLPENAPVYGDMSVQEYLRMIAALRGIGDGDFRGRFSEAVIATGLEAMLTRPIAELSKGYRQRVGIAQAIIHRPSLLILDEPTTGLDPAQIVEIRSLIRELSRDATVLLSTHILPEVELTCERALIIMRGQLCADASLDELRASNAAIVSIADVRGEAAEALSALEGVDSVTALPGGDDQYHRYRISARSDVRLCSAIFELIKARDWSIDELRPDVRTLEDVFNQLVRTEQMEAAANEDPTTDEEVSA